MSINYLDTITMFLPCPVDIRSLFTTHWIWDTRDKDFNYHHFCIKTNFAFLRYYPDMYGYRRLYFTCSLPKLYYHGNSNVHNVTDYDNQRFMDAVRAELSQALDVTQLPMRLADWQPSRIDMFRNRTINPVDRMEYHLGYSRLMYRGVSTTAYKNTNYLPSSVHSKHPCILLRSYNKTIEQQNRQAMILGYLPSAVELEHEQLMMDFDIPNDLYRHEFSLRRNAVIRYCKKFNHPVNMETIMDETFQRFVLNELVISRGLHHHILCKKDFRAVLPTIFATQKSINNALKLAESIRNKSPLPLSPQQRYRIQHELNSFFINTSTTNFVSISGLKLL